MTLQQHYQTRARHLRIAQNCAWMRDRIALDHRFGRLRGTNVRDATRTLTATIIHHLRLVQHHTGHIETLEIL